MRTSLLGHLERDDLGRPGLTSLEESGDQVETGILRGRGKAWFPVERGVPAFLRGELRPDHSAFAARHGLAAARRPRRPPASSQAKTTETFSDKWRRFRTYGLEPSHREFLFDWYVKKLGLPDRAALEAFYRSRTRILEVGPGSGFNTRFMAELCPGEVFAADISEAAFTTYQNTRHLKNCHVVQADLMDLPFPDGYFDFAIADGVLHHTPDTRRAMEAVFRKVRPGGQFFFYVYRQMGPARLFCDRHIRERLSRLDPEECYRACEPLTELGRALSALKATVTLEKGVPLLGIPPGTHDVQRLVYYNFVKCFWNDAFDYETNNMVNFDWYHPHDAWQHTQEEVEGWLRDLGVTEYAFHPANPNGISTLLTRPERPRRAARTPAPRRAPRTRRKA